MTSSTRLPRPTDRRSARTTRSVRATARLGALLLAVGLAVSVAPAPAAQASPRATAHRADTAPADTARALAGRSVTASPARPMVGERTTFSGRLSPRGKPVRLEVRAGGRWRTVARSRVGAGARYRLAARVHRTATYRVKARGFTSRTLRVRVIGQSVQHSTAAPFVVGLTRTVTATPSPRRSGREVALQRRTGTTWTTVVVRRTDGSGVARLPRTGTSAGPGTYRVVGRSFRGSRTVASAGFAVRTAAATEQASVGTPAAASSDSPSVSADGRWVAFTSTAALLPSDTDAFDDIYLFDRRTGALSHLVAGADHHTNNPVVSADGRYVAFQTIASNLFDEPGYDYDVAVLDRANGEIDLVSRAASGEAPGNDDSYLHDMSDDGRTVAFGSTATDLVSFAGPPDTTVRHAYVRNRFSGGNRPLDRIGLGWSDANIFSLDLSADGTRVAFGSTDTELDPGNVDGSAIFAADVAADGAVSGRTNLTPDLDADSPSLSGDGDVLAFTTDVALSLADANGVRDTYLLTGPSSYLLAGPSGAAGNPGGTISDDGRFVTTATKNTLPGDTNGGQADVVVWTRSSGASLLVTKAGAGASGEEELSRDGSVLVFGSAADIVPGVTGDYNSWVTVLR